MEKELQYEIQFILQGMGKKEFWGFTIAGDTWKLQVMPEKGLGNKRMLLFLLCGGSIVLLLLIGLTVAVMVTRRKTKTFSEKCGDRTKWWR